ncbi:MAG: AAA family ATPase [Deltaproteobacteria bacterium]|nr:AAA family ATPase [Deltaproteobacteria bacterium]
MLVSADQAVMPMNVAKTRLTQTFKFLKELNDLRNPVPRDLSNCGKLFWIDEWPSHPLIEVRRGDRKDEDDGEGAELEPLIRLRRADLTPCPKPPEALDGWLKPGWQSIETAAEVIDSRNFQDRKNDTITVAFGDDPERVTVLNTWTAVRDKWAAAERPAVVARKLFEEVHALWTAIQREGDRTELVLGDGILDVPADSIRHPVLLQRLNLRFDPAGPEFRFDAGTDRVELQRALLRLVPSVEGRMIAQFDRELETAPVEPLGGESTTGFLRRLVHGLFATDGEFLDNERRDLAPRPSMRRKPVIFVRARNAGLATTLDHIVEDLEQNDTQPPEGLVRIVGVETSESPLASGATGNREAPRRQSAAEPDILFSKPANAEQYEIAARLAKSQAVLVQGPPGTGKTHTIANLLGCLLAQGKTVLVTAHTTKALRVLRDKVDDALKSLCLSVLDSDTESQDQLKLAAQEIASRLSTSDAASLRRDAALLREKRTKLLAAEAALRRQLRDARFSEVEEIVIGGEALSPIEVAKQVKVDEQRDAWIPGPLRPGILCPLVDTEIRQLYVSSGTLTVWDETQLSVPQPVVEHLVAPADFRLLGAEKAGADVRAQAHRPELWNHDAGRNLTAADLQRLHQRLKAASTLLSEQQLWLREVLFAGWTGGDLAETWRDLLAAIDSLVSEAGTAHRLIAAHGPDLPDGVPLDQVAATLGQILDHLEHGGFLGLKTKMTKRAWHALLERCRIDVGEEQAGERIRALRAKAQLQVNRSRLSDRWRRLVECHDGPTFDTFGASPERAALGFAQEIRTRLDWRTTVWEPLIGELRTGGLRWEQWLGEHPPIPGDHGELMRVERAGSEGLAAVVEAQAALMLQRELSAALSQQRTYLSGFTQSEAAAVLLQAHDNWDTDTYEEACRQLARLEGLRDTYQTRLALLNRLQTAAPEWARAIEQRQGAHCTTQPPGEPGSAWRWRQWHDELERRASVSISDLQERLYATQNELRSLAAEIIEHETWAAQRERTMLQSQQALMGYVQTIRKVGKGTGKRVPELLRQARQLLTTARRAVPVWIMPLSRVYESFDPRETRFDVVIIDEAAKATCSPSRRSTLGESTLSSVIRSR